MGAANEPVSPLLRNAKFATEPVWVSRRVAR